VCDEYRAFALLLVWGVPQAVTHADAEQTKILALENAWNQAEEHKDIKALDSLLDSTLVYIDYDGSMMDKAQFIESIKAPSLHPEQLVNESMTARVYGDTAAVTGVYRERGEKNGKPYSRRGRFTDTWVYHDGAWVCVASQSTLIMH
jgi:ketosteroid isomerase-like protein